jgi:hypothetical protein
MDSHCKVTIKAKTTIKYIAIVFAAAILIQSGIFILMLFRQFIYGIHPINNPPRGITLKNDPPKVTSNQSLSSLDDKKSTSWIDISQAIGAIPSAVALFFVGFQTTQSRKQMGLTQQEIGQTQKEMLLAQSGFLKLDCSYETKEGKKYIVSKPLLENISRRPIDVAMTL